MSKKAILNIITVVFVIVALVSGGYILYHQWQSHVSKAKFEKLQHKKQADVKRKYKQMMGWLEIKKTNIDHPVMQPPKNDPKYWLRKDIDGKYSINGTLFSDPNSDVKKSYNIIIYGHHMMDGTMFGDLQKYESSKFRKKRQNILFTKWYGKKSYSFGKYKVFSTFRCTVNDKESYLDYANIRTQHTFNKYMKYCKRMSQFKSNMNPRFGDEVITLSTCSYHVSGKDGRFVVVAVKKN